MNCNKNGNLVGVNNFAYLNFQTATPTAATHCKVAENVERIKQCDAQTKKSRKNYWHFYCSCQTKWSYKMIWLQAQKEYHFEKEKQFFLIK